MSGTRNAAAIAAAVRPATTCSLTDEDARTSNGPVALGSRAVAAVFSGLKKVVEPASGSLRLAVEGEGSTAMATTDADAILRCFCSVSVRYRIPKVGAVCFDMRGDG